MNSAAACDVQRSLRSCRKSRRWHCADCGSVARTSLQRHPHYELASRAEGLGPARARPALEEMECLQAMLAMLPVRLQPRARPQPACSAARFLAPEEAAWFADAS